MDTIEVKTEELNECLGENARKYIKFPVLLEKELVSKWQHNNI